MNKNELQKFKELPKGWEISTLGEVLPVLYGKGLTKAKRDNDGPYAVYGSSGKVGNHSKALTEKSALIIGRKGSVGEVYYSRFPCWPIDTTYYVEEKENQNLPFFKYLLTGLMLSQLDKSTAIPGLSRDDYNNVQVAIAPFKEQKRIVAEIEKQFSRLDEAIDNLKRVKANLKRYKASVLKAAVEGKLTEEWRAKHPGVEPADKLLERILVERRKKWEEAEFAKIKKAGKKPKDEKWEKKYKEPAKPNLDDLPSLPGGWLWVSLETTSEALGGYAFKSKKYSESGYQIVKMANIKMNMLDLSQRPSFITDIPDHIFDKYSLIDGDILITLTGTRKKRDYGYIVEIKNHEKSLLLNQRIARLRPYIQGISSYISIAIQSEDFRDRFFSYETGNVGQGNVGMRAVTIEVIALPPLAEQKKIIVALERSFSMADRIYKQVDRNLKRADRLRQSILRKAFSGKLIQNKEL